MYYHQQLLGSVGIAVPNFYRRNTFIHIVVATLLSVTALPALSEQESNNKSSHVEELIVVGFKRSVARKDYAGSVSVINQQQLTSTQASSVVDIASMVPGLFAQETGSRNPTPVIMRGVNFDGMSNNNLGGDTYTVASYLNNIPLQGYYAPPQVVLKDLQAVEVLRGPQGTLYGASSLSGLIAYQTTKPVVDESSLVLHSRYSQTDKSDSANSDSDIVINTPVMEGVLTMRAMIGYSENAGFIDNNLLLTGPETDVNDDRVSSGRLSFLLTPTERLSATLMVQQQRTKSGDFQADNPAVTGQEYMASTYYLQPMQGDLNLADLELQYNFNSFTLRATSNYYAYNLGQTTDFSAFYKFNGYSVDADGGDSGFTESDVDVEQSNIEVRVSSNWSGAVSGIVGLSYSENILAHSSEDNLTDSLGSQQQVEYTYTQDQNLQDTALFGELSWQANESIAFTMGGRYFGYRDTFDSCDAFYSDPLSCLVQVENDSTVNFSLAGLYHLNHSVSLFSTIAEGFRRGGANAVPSDLAEHRAYSPDTTVNYELGLFTHAGQQLLTYGITLFYIDWNEIQLFTSDYSTSLGWSPSFIANANDAESMGVELELSATLSDNLAISGFYSYSRAQLAEAALSYNSRAGDGDNGYKGDRLPGSPKQQAQLTLDYQNHWQSFVVDANLSVRYTGSVTTQLNNEHFGYNTLDGHTLVNAGFGVARNQWRMGIFARNLGNKRAVSAEDRGEFGPESALSYVARPRTIGVDLRYQF